MANKINLENYLERPIIRHLKRLTTPYGLIQHADFEVPDPSHGYSIDDNARALIVCLWHYQNFQDPAILHLAEIYLDYLEKVQTTEGTFHNFVSFSNKKLDEVGSDDSIGRAIWALGETIQVAPNEEFVQKATQMLDKAIFDKHLDHRHTRTKAYILLGLLAANRLEAAKKWADKLTEIYDREHSSEWDWFEDGLYYANGILPYALAKAAAVLKNKQYEEVAAQSYEWLDKISRGNSTPSPIGQDGWFIKGKEKATFDQQPLEAADMVLAALELFRLTNDQKFMKSAAEWMDWYKGNNISNVTLINEVTGGIYDGITPNGVNKNQGAESIVTYLLAYLAITKLANDKR